MARDVPSWRVMARGYKIVLNNTLKHLGRAIRSPFSLYGGDRMVAAILIGIGVIGVFSVLVVLGCCALTVHDSDLLHQHPPDPDPRHRQWPQDGDDP